MVTKTEEQPAVSLSAGQRMAILKALGGYLRERRDDWHAIFAGEGDARPELDRLTAELGLECRERIIGDLGPSGGQP